MVSLEQQIKDQYARIFCLSDGPLFRWAAEAQFEEAAHLKSDDMRFEHNFKLLARNSRKRLLIGIGVELLLKAIYLKNGFCINKQQNQKPKVKFPFTFQQVEGIALDATDTFSLNFLIEHISRVVSFPDVKVVMRGLKIAKVFRNKEGHVVTATHTYDPENYRDIERTLVAIYEHVFLEKLDVRFAVGAQETPIWKLLPLQR